MSSGTRDGYVPAGFIEATDPATGAVHEAGINPTTKALLVESVGGSSDVTTVVTAVNAVNTSLVDTLANYKLADYEVTASFIYVGKLDKAGNWYITRITLSTGAVTYSKAASGYSTQWTGRASPTPAYAAFDTMF